MASMVCSLVILLYLLLLCPSVFSCQISQIVVKFHNQTSMENGIMALMCLPWYQQSGIIVKNQ